MKTKFILLLFFVHSFCYAQYIGVRARYTETRLVDDLPNPPKRENRLILSFFEVSDAGIYTPIVLSNYDIWIYKGGLQYGSLMGGVLDSTGNNYPNYPWTAPRVVSYFNTYVLNYIDCTPNLAEHYVVNGQELDCGFITVSYWTVDNGNGNSFEAFPAPNVCLPYYQFPHPYAALPGNVNFEWPIPPGAPYNYYNFSCAGSPLQLAIRGVLPGGQGNFDVPLPVTFSDIRGEIFDRDSVAISWANLSEASVQHYEIESSADGSAFVSLDIVAASGNNGERSDYRKVIFSNLSAHYRIKAVEINGSFFYSKVINVKISVPMKVESFSVYPNPVTGEQINVKLINAKAGRYLFFVLSPLGVKSKLKMIDHEGGDLYRQIELHGLPRGNYKVVLQGTERKYSQNIIYVN